MPDPKRIDAIILRLAQYWQRNNELRLGEILRSMAAKRGYIYDTDDVEDEELLVELTRHWIPDPGYDNDRSLVNELQCSLGLLVRNEHVRAAMRRHDPKALEQADRAMQRWREVGARGTPLLPEGTHVCWTSRQTKEFHTGTIVTVMPERLIDDRKVYLVRPDNRGARWTDWLTPDEAQTTSPPCSVHTVAERRPAPES